jgi:hypothetical protein
MLSSNFLLAILGLCSLGLWLAFGDPPKATADLFWPQSEAPWESVDAFFYPDKGNRIEAKVQRGLDSVQACRQWVDQQVATAAGRGAIDYRCAVGADFDAELGISLPRIVVR